MGKIGVNIFFGLSVVYKGRLDLWIFCMMDERSNICLFIFFPCYFLLSFVLGVLLYLVVFIASEGRQEATDRWVKQRGYRSVYRSETYQVRDGMFRSLFCSPLFISRRGYRTLG